MKKVFLFVNGEGVLFAKDVSARSGMQESLRHMHDEEGKEIGRFFVDCSDFEAALRDLESVLKPEVYESLVKGAMSMFEAGYGACLVAYDKAQPTSGGLLVRAATNPTPPVPTAFYQ